MSRGRLTVATSQYLRMAMESPDQSMGCLGCSGSGPGRKTIPLNMGDFTGKPSQWWVVQNGTTSNIYGWFFIALYINITSCKGLWKGLWRVCQALTVKIPKIEHRHSSGWVCKQSRYAQLRFLERRIHGDLTYNLQVDCKHLQSKLFRFFFWYSLSN